MKQEKQLRWRETNKAKKSQRKRDEKRRIQEEIELIDLSVQVSIDAEAKKRQRKEARIMKWQHRGRRVMRHSRL